MQEILLNDPVALALGLIAAILVGPLISEKLRLPGIVGLFGAGILMGPYGLNLIAKGTRIELLATIGLVYLMFNAGLEIDLIQFRQLRSKSLLFGIFSFIIPLSLGTVVGILLNMNIFGAFLLGSVFSSHTLISYPIASRMGIIRNEAVTATIGATVYTDVASLLVVSFVIGSYNGELGLVSVVLNIAVIAAYVLSILW